MHNQRLHRSAFQICTPKAALKHFRKRARKKPRTTGFEHSTIGTLDRLDINLVLLGIAPTVFWARRFIKFGLLRINGALIRDAAYRLQSGAFIEWQWNKIMKFQSHFLAGGLGKNVRKPFTNLLVRGPKNFEFSRLVRAARYLRRPVPGDLQENGRIVSRLFTAFRLDSGLGK